jgi:purine-binding chemotaxis protein CheW
VSVTVRQYLTVLIFEVDGHPYGLDTSQIIEVVRAVQPTRLAQAPDIVEGIINVRGRVAVVIDLRTRFELTRRPIAPSDVLLLCEIDGRLFALRADATRALQSIDASQLADCGQIGAAVSFVRGALTLQDGLVLLCDLKSFLNEAEQLSLSRALSRREVEEASA